MTITLRIMLPDDDEEIASVEAEMVPRVGETVWLRQGVGSERQTTSWKVTEVAYWLHADMRIPSYAVALYVEAIK